MQDITRNPKLETRNISFDQAMEMTTYSGVKLFNLFNQAGAIREKNFGNKIDSCYLLNAKSNLCGEDCIYCSQSTRYPTAIDTYKLMPKEKIVAAAESAANAGANHFCIVISGRGITDKEEIETICNAAREIKTRFPTLVSCASLGIIDEETACAIKEAGIVRYNHNLNTEEEFHKKVVTTHTYQDRLRTAQIVRKAGLELCCGCIWGMGETVEQRIKLAFDLRDLAPEEVPINFLYPIPGTPLENAPGIQPMEALRFLAIYRLILPDCSEIRVAGGREKNLRDLQSWIFQAGASGLVLGDYLTTKGQSQEKTKQMLADLNLMLRPMEETQQWHNQPSALS